MTQTRTQISKKPEKILTVPSSTCKPLAGFSPRYPPVLRAKLHGSWVNVAVRSGSEDPGCRQVID